MIREFYAASFGIFEGPIPIRLILVFENIQMSVILYILSNWKVIKIHCGDSKKNVGKTIK